MKYYIIAGEASGDLHGSNLIRAIKKIDKEALFRAWGGDMMETAGAHLVRHFRDHAFMGLMPVLKHYGIIRKNFKLVVKDLEDYKPDALILIDYSGFNLRVAKKVKHLGFKIFYYISPQVWAWRHYRANTIKKLIDKMFSILPFEKEFYKKYDFDVEYVGHPLLDSIGDFRSAFKISRDEFFKKNNLSDKPLIVILPGSRKQEIQAMFPIMLKSSQNFPEYQFVIAGTSAIDTDIYKQYMKEYNVNLIFGQTYELLSFAKAAMVTSGTATLETALLKIPQVVCYRAGLISYYIVKSMVNVKYISLVNLIMDNLVIPELIQNDLTVDNLTGEVEKLMENSLYRAEMLKEYDLLEEKLGKPGASMRAATGICQALTNA